MNSLRMPVVTRHAARKRQLRKISPLSLRTAGVAPSGRRVLNRPRQGLDASFVGLWWIMALFGNLGSWRKFFYLDAHWEGDLPLQEEIEIILRRFPNFLIMIDDFRVPGDSGYGFDDYGPTKMLALRDFPFHEDRRMSVYFPTCRSEVETGTKRGCVVLVAPSLAMLISETGALRRYVCEA